MTLSAEDPRRHIPRVDELLALPEVAEARDRLSETVIRETISDVLMRARAGRLVPRAADAAGGPAVPQPHDEPDTREAVIAALARALAGATPSTVAPVLNGTGVVIHTNLGRAPLSDAARDAVLNTSGYADVELSLETGKRSGRGVGARAALLAACPEATDALVVNNGAAALLLAVTALSAGREVVISRGELVEIGAGFRLPDLMETTGSRLREVGTTNRTHAADYERALIRGAAGSEAGTGALGTAGSAPAGCVVKVHPSNFRVEGFTSDVGIRELRRILDAHETETGRRIPLIVDIGSGLLAHDPLLPDEPDLATALRDGADIVIASGDKLLGGPQAGIVLGRREDVQRMAKHSLARAVRCDKLTLAALEATLRGPSTPVADALHAESRRLRARARAIRDGVLARTGVALDIVPHDGRVGGGGAPGVPLPGWAVELPAAFAPLLRRSTPTILTRVHQDRCLLDLRCIPEADDARVLARLIGVAGGVGGDGDAGSRQDRAH